MFSTKVASDSGDFDLMIFPYVKVVQFSFVCLIHSSKFRFSLQDWMTVETSYNNSLCLQFNYNVLLNTVLGSLKDSNAAVHSVDSDIFYAVSHLAVHSKTYINS